MAQRDAKTVKCPFCGAPYRSVVPSDALQLKCDYCGARFYIPPKLGVEVSPCRNHPDRFAAGICNDCGQSFCSECLQPYDISSENVRARLYLCPECLRGRYAEKANAAILVGTLFLMLGTFVVFFMWTFGAPLIVAGVIFVSYGYSKKRSQIPHEAAVDRTQSEGEEEIRPELTEEQEREEAMSLYDRLLTKYVDHWGVRTGAELLENEIKACTWQGDTFVQAVRKVYERQKKKAT